MDISVSMDTENGTDWECLSDWEAIPQPQDDEIQAEAQAQWETWDWESERVPAVLSPTYKQRNEDFRKLFKQLPDSERLIVDYSCALQRDIPCCRGALRLEKLICFIATSSAGKRWYGLWYLTNRLLCPLLPQSYVLSLASTVRLKDICSMTKEKTARLIPNAIQLCTDNDK
ncbi:protein Aster-B-like, partial [Oncorhynchus masou masou]|uniref:protein Aster-B-like n=1 Tax=Oncorhynchus masou masou TaxID=90313 RepID=UPI003183C007